MIFLKILIIISFIIFISYPKELVIKIPPKIIEVKKELKLEEPIYELAQPKIILDNILIENVPFSTQAPFANWKDERQQDGCEESSAIMAYKWTLGEELKKEEALDYIIKISDYEEKIYGEYRDVGVRDVIKWIFKDYLKYEKVELVENITKEKIIEELNNNKIFLIPTNGQLLNNPNFILPGPITHMVVLHGYDIKRNIFITHDPGTRLGENYEYDMDLFYEAINSYPTGYHEKIDEIKKEGILIWK